MEQRSCVTDWMLARASTSQGSCNFFSAASSDKSLALCDKLCVEDPPTVGRRRCPSTFHRSTVRSISSHVTSHNGLLTYCNRRFLTPDGPYLSKNIIMAANKALLKEIGQDIQKSKFGDAISKAKEVLERDAKNYQASVTLLLEVMVP